MITLVIVGLLAGVITSISPCVLPVLPVVLTASAGSAPRERAGATAAAGVTVAGVESAEVATSDPRRSRRPYGIVAGLVVGFAVFTLFGSLVLSALHLPEDLLRYLGIAALVVIGLGLVSRRVNMAIERPFSRLQARNVDLDRNGIIVGLGLGALYVPCAGPVLAAIAVVGATHRVGWQAVVLTGAFAVGVGIPLLVLALAGDAVVGRVGALRRRARGLRVTGGVLMLVVAVAIGLNLTDGLQRAVPGYTAALQSSVEHGSAVTNRLHGITSGSTTHTGTTAAAPEPPARTCVEGSSVLQSCGPAPAFTGITDWLNTPDGQPLTMTGLRGKVVLIDFWTYSCINCQRTLPHLEAWYRAYHRDGLEIIGVHTPEFAFEHVIGNVRSRAQALGVRYPIAIDNAYATWNAYGNEYWPADYLVDRAGTIRHVTFGEGGYVQTEQLIRTLLTSRHPHVVLPPATEVPDTTPTQVQTPETYLGGNYAPLHVTGPAPADGTHTYTLPSRVEPNTFALAGTWTGGAEALTAGAHARLELDYQARDVYLVLGQQRVEEVAV